MQLELTEDERAFRDEMREFFTTKVSEETRETVAAGRELTKDQLVESMRTLNAAGLAVPRWPVEWGGQDWTEIQFHIWREEMERACVPTPLAFNAGMIGPVIAQFGTEEQKKEFLPKTANIDIFWSQGFSEPDAGSDLAGLRTTAVKDGDDWVVNGQKTWTTLGQHGDWIFTLVRTDPDAKKQAGISMLLIDMESEGLEVRPIQLIDGGHEVNEVWFEDVRVPGENLVGELNGGWSIAKFLLGNERVGVAPSGIIKRVLGRIKGLAEDRFADDPLLRARIAELENELLALELTTMRVAANSVEGKPDPASSVLKLKGSVLQQQVSELVLDLAGPAGLASGAADDDSDLSEWERTRRPDSTSTCARPPSTAAPTRCSARSSPATSWVSERTTTMDFLYDDEQDALREAVKGLVGKAYGDYENRRQTVAEDPGFDEKQWTQDGRDGAARAAVLRGGRRRRRRPGRDRHRLPGARPGDRARALPHVGGAGRWAGLRVRHRGAAAGAPRRAVRRRARARLRARRAGPRLDAVRRAGHRRPGRRRPGR